MKVGLLDELDIRRERGDGAVGGGGMKVGLGDELDRRRERGDGAVGGGGMKVEGLER